KIDNSNTVKLKEQLDYSNIAKLNAVGLDFIVSPPLRHETPISTILKPVMLIENDLIKANCSQAAFKAFEQVIKLEPMFPFSYYYAGTCLKKMGVSDWKSYIDSAHKILVITTEIAGHNINHDQALKDILENYK
ncbi:MAG: hypothetical protein WC323_04400, partial [Patescibacteria group bacterium]